MSESVEELMEKLAAAQAEIARLTAELQRVKALLRQDLPYDAMGGYEY